MAKFRYSGILFDGKAVQGEIEARSREEAMELLQRRRIRLEKIAPVSTLTLNLSSGVGIRELSRFTRQFSAMTAAGLPMVACLDTISGQVENRPLREAVAKVSVDVQGGGALAEALSQHPRIFNRLYCAMVRAGEAGGMLGDILKRLADYQERQANLQRRIRGALAYPAVVLLVTAGALAALMTFVVPTFASMLTDLGAALPASTRLVIQASEIVRRFWMPALASFAGILIWFVLSYRRSPAFRLQLDTLLLRLPVLGDLARKSAIARFSRTLGALLTGGVPLPAALEITAETAGNGAVEAALLQTLEAVKAGNTISSRLARAGLFPAMVVQMVSVGERTGGLAEMLTRISDYYEVEVDTALGTVTSLIEPVLIVLMGIAVAAVLIAMYLPMFEITQGLG